MDKTRENTLVKACLNKDRKAQNELYQIFASPMMGLCLRYGKNKEEAEDILLEGFYNVFKDMHTFKGTGPLGGWIRMVMIHTALRYIQKHRKKMYPLVSFEEYMDESKESNIFQTFEAAEVISLLQKLPLGFRTVLNLYAIESFSHKEIAEALNISVGTSKSQLSRARKMMLDLMKNNEKNNEFKKAR